MTKKGGAANSWLRHLFLSNWWLLEHQLQSRAHAAVAAICLREVVEGTRSGIKTGRGNGGKLLVVENVEGVQAGFQLYPFTESKKLEEAHVKIHDTVGMLSVATNGGRPGHDQRRSRVGGYLDGVHVVASDTSASCSHGQLRIT